MSSWHDVGPPEDPTILTRGPRGGPRAFRLAEGVQVQGRQGNGAPVFLVDSMERAVELGLLVSTSATDQDKEDLAHLEALAERTVRTRSAREVPLAGPPTEPDLPEQAEAPFVEPEPADVDTPPGSAS